MKHMTVTFLFSPDKDEVLLLLKNRGPYTGAWNGVGGKVEDGEHSYIRSAVREVEEETGVKLIASDLQYLLSCNFMTGTALHVFTGIVDKDAPRQCESEQIKCFL